MNEVIKMGEAHTGRVRSIQIALQKLGYQIGTPDDWFGSRTLAAVQLFQQSRKLPATGEVDRATYDALMRAASGDSLKPYQIVVGSQDFTTWFNAFRSRHPAFYPHALQAAGFRRVWGRLDILLGKADINLSEFVAHFCIIYNETGGSFEPISEWGGSNDANSFVNDAYFFRAIAGKKLSYNTAPNIGAGTLLREAGVISGAADVGAWNNTLQYPSAQPLAVRLAARNCDFYKFRGRGLNQITWRNGYQKYVDPALIEAGLKPSAQCTERELAEAFHRPEVYCAVFRQYISDMTWAGRALVSIHQGDFSLYPKYVAGWGAVAYHQLFAQRCHTLRQALASAGWAVVR